MELRTRFFSKGMYPRLGTLLEGESKQISISVSKFVFHSMKTRQRFIKSDRLAKKWMRNTGKQIVASIGRVQQSLIVGWCVRVWEHACTRRMSACVLICVCVQMRNHVTRSLREVKMLTLRVYVCIYAYALGIISPCFHCRSTFIYGCKC